MKKRLAKKKAFRAIFLFLLLAMPFIPASAQQFNFGRIADDAELSKAMPNLAKQVIAGYRDEDRQKYLNNLFKLQMIAGDYAAATDAIKSLREIPGANDPVYRDATNLQYEIYANAKLNEARGNVSFEDAFKQAFRETVGKLDDLTAFRVSGAFAYNLNNGQSELRKLLDLQKDGNGIELAGALALAEIYAPYQVYKNILPLAPALLLEDDNKRYIIEDDVLIKTRDGATLSAIVVRKRGVAARQPTALVFNIYTDISLRLARQSAAYGYVGVTAETRGKRNSPDPVDPYEHEADDVYEAVDWVSRQAWSDGQVGIYGNSYCGYTAWAATKKKPHPALKTIAPSAAIIPGFGLPMMNNVFLNANYGWTFYVTNTKLLDDKTYYNPERWRALNWNWYQSGKSYRDYDKVDGTPNKWLQRWLDHPAFDRYWQAKVPYKNDFSKINIPVLSVTGYYDDAQISAIQYLKEHYKYNKNANHYLVIGPYGHFAAGSSRKPTTFNGYTIDPVAQMDTPELTFRWFDFVMRGRRKPALLKDKINYQVMGANEWRHAPTLEKMSNQTLTLYLTETKASGNYYRLNKTKPTKTGFLEQTVNFTDRENLNGAYYPWLIIGKPLDLSPGYLYVSEPLDEPVSINGAFAGEIKAAVNKKDMDVNVTLYELMPDGKPFQLSYFIGRASYAADMTVRRLLTPGKVESIPFDRTYMVSRRLSRGSRLLVAVDVNKSPFEQINYGTGKDVSDEDIRDAEIPLKIKWRNDSYVKIPIWK
jgi:putative CocE/NonD family hydrolase